MDLPRWIITSVNKHFDDRKQNIPLYFGSYEGDIDWAELRFTGPSITRYTVGCFKVECSINLLMTSFLGFDEYKIYRMTGIFSEAFCPICVYRYGDGPDDDQTLVGTLNIIDGQIDVVQLGIIAPEAKFKRSFIDANYEMYL